MAFAIIVALVVLVATLIYLYVEQGKSLNKYEEELMNRKTKSVKKGKK